jgi:hypothetical protein
MSEEEQTEFEMRYFGDAELFGQLCAWRNHLIDGYVSGQLSPSMRQRFEAGIENSWAVNERIRFAETLQGEIDTRSGGFGSPRRGRFARIRESSWRAARGYRRPVLVAAILLSISGVAWLIFRSRQDSLNESARSENSSSGPSAQDPNRSTQSQPNLKESANNSGTRTSGDLSSVLTIPLTSAVTGTASDVRADVLIPPSTVIVKLVLIVDQPQDADYSAIVTTAKDAEIFRTDYLKPHTNEAGKAVELYVPANRLPEGDCIVQLRGVTANNESLAVEKYYLRVRKG